MFGTCVELDGGLWEGELIWGALEGDFEEHAFLGVWLLGLFFIVFIFGYFVVVLLGGRAVCIGFLIVGGTGFVTLMGHDHVLHSRHPSDPSLSQGALLLKRMTGSPAPRPLHGLHATRAIFGQSQGPLRFSRSPSLLLLFDALPLKLTHETQDMARLGVVIRTLGPRTGPDEQRLSLVDIKGFLWLVCVVARISHQLVLVQCSDGVIHRDGGHDFLIQAPNLSVQKQRRKEREKKKRRARDGHETEETAAQYDVGPPTV